MCDLAGFSKDARLPDVCRRRGLRAWLLTHGVLGSCSQAQVSGKGTVDEAWRVIISRQPAMAVSHFSHTASIVILFLFDREPRSSEQYLEEPTETCKGTKRHGSE